MSSLSSPLVNPSSAVVTPTLTDNPQVAELPSYGATGPNSQVLSFGYDYHVSPGCGAGPYPENALRVSLTPSKHDECNQCVCATGSCCPSVMAASFGCGATAVVTKVLLLSVAGLLSPFPVIFCSRFLCCPERGLLPLCPICPDPESPESPESLTYREVSEGGAGAGLGHSRRTADVINASVPVALPVDAVPVGVPVAVPVGVPVVADMHR